MADADHVCLCDCLDAFPRTFHTSDGLGAISLGYVGSTGFPVGTVGWSALRNLTGQTTYCLFSALDCRTFSGKTTQVTYKLGLNCTTGWTFSLSYVTGGGFCGVGFADNSCPNFSNTQPSDAIAFTCDFSLLEFNLPTTAGGWAVPGGGGYYPITP